MDRARVPVIERFEAIGAIALLGISTSAMVAGMLWSLRGQSHGSLPPTTNLNLLAIIGCAYFAASVASLVFLIRAYRNARSPMLLQMALHHKEYGIARPDITVWWAHQFLTMVCAADLFMHEIQIRYASSPYGLMSLSLRVVASMAAGSAANLFLLLGFRAGGQDPDLIERFFKWRFAFDFGFACAVTALPKYVAMLFAIPFQVLFFAIFGKH